MIPCKGTAKGPRDDGERGDARLVVIDLEFNSGMYGERLEEVLQIGAVKCERLGGPITGTFSAYIRPCVHKRFSPGARVLPELERSKRSSVTFREALEEFVDWCGCETEFGEWGRDDFKILTRNAAYFGIKYVFPEKCLDVQAAFAKTLGQVNAVPLYLACEYCRIPDSFVFHNALNDAVYTCLVGKFADRDCVEASVFALTQQDIFPAPKPKKPRRGQIRCGPFKSREMALNNMGSRRAVCPKCLTVSRVATWYTSGGGTYYSPFSCDDHGRYIRRLQLVRQPDGVWWTYNEVVEATPENLRRLSNAQAAGSFACAQRTGSSRHRRKKK